MKFSLSIKIIISMAAVVFLTALTSFIVSLVIINNQTQQFEQRLEGIKYQVQTNFTPDEALTKVRAIVTNPNLTARQQFNQLLESFRPPQLDADKVKLLAAESGWPISIPLDSNQNITGLSQPSPQPITNLFTNSTYRSLLIASLISVVFAIGLGILLSRTVIRPLRALERASERIADGNYTLVLEPEGKDDLGRLAASFNKMSRALRQTEQKRKDLVADLSHELSTPLSGIQGYTEALRDGLVKNQERRDQIYDHILKEVKYLTGMVNSMRQWTKNEQLLEQLTMEVFEIEPVLMNVTQRFGPAAESKGVALTLDIPSPSPRVLADQDCLTHILNNLVDNALRYTPAGGEISISARPKQGQLWFEVRDTGVGIPAEHLPFIFERFYRVDKSRDRATGGSGLGLAIVREAVLAQGGNIKIETEVGQGTRIIFQLNAAKADLPELLKQPLSV